ncbi:EamA family transporter [Cellulomonas massiliensis]|uniref:EamA family transporter n=1 Tax=Cellulomonas massiliensis TaxID=1465811 RepID=UPI000305523B|nr:EamA family transporter [Cellulomonas massiliensis]
MSTTARRHFALVALAGVLWGTGGLAGAGLIDATGASATAVACYRLLGGGLLLALLVVGTPGGLARVPRTRAAGTRVVTTALLIAAFEAAYFAGVARAGVALATVVTLGAAPVMVAAASAVRARRAPDRTTATALVLALLGLVALVGTSGSGASGPRPTLGVALSLVAAAAFGALTAVQTRPVPGLEPVALIGAGFTLGGLLLVPAALVDGGLVLPHDTAGWGLLLYLAAVPTAAAYAAYFTGLRTVPATTATLLALLEPLTAAVGAVVVRHERLGPVALAGGALMLTAVVVLRPRGAPSPTMDAPGRAAGPEGHPDAVRAEGCDDVGSGA